MIVSSAKKRLRTSAIFALLLPGAVTAAPSLIPEFRLELNSRLAFHTFAPQDLASHRHTLELEQKFKMREWTAVIGAQGYAETAFSSSARYGGEVARNESQEVVPRDIYVQYKGPGVLVKAGNQQVVWGEAFGFYFADIINPKDTRDFGLGDLTRQRIPIPMLDAKFIGSKTTLELVYIPKPYFNKVPSQGNDFHTSYQALFGGAAIPVTDERTLPLALENGEVGARVGTKLGPVDMGVFYFNYHDREPKYQLLSTEDVPPVVTFAGQHARLQTVGTTGATELGPWVLRWEALYSWNRFFSFIDQGFYNTFSTQETTAVLGVEYSAVADWRLGFQASNAYLTDVPEGTFTPRHRPLLTALIAGPLIKDQSIDLMFTFVPTDSSSLVQVKYLVPLTSRIELNFGADLLLGEPATQFGRFRNASRGYVLLKAFLAGT